MVTIHKSSLIFPHNTQMVDGRNLEKIILVRYNGRGGGGFYYLVTKSEKGIKLFVIPLYDLDKESSTQIGNRFAELLGVPFET